MFSDFDLSSPLKKIRNTDSVEIPSQSEQSLLFTPKKTPPKTETLSENLEKENDCLSVNAISAQASLGAEQPNSSLSSVEVFELYTPKTDSERLPSSSRKTSLAGSIQKARSGSFGRLSQSPGPVPSPGIHRPRLSQNTPETSQKGLRISILNSEKKILFLSRSPKHEPQIADTLSLEDRIIGPLMLGPKIAEAESVKLPSNRALMKSSADGYVRKFIEKHREQLESHPFFVAAHPLMNEAITLSSWVFEWGHMIGKCLMIRKKPEFPFEHNASNLIAIPRNINSHMLIYESFVTILADQCLHSDIEVAVKAQCPKDYPHIANRLSYKALIYLDRDHNEAIEFINHFDIWEGLDALSKKPASKMISTLFDSFNRIVKALSRTENFSEQVSNNLALLEDKLKNCSDESAETKVLQICEDLKSIFSQDLSMPSADSLADQENPCSGEKRKRP